MTLMTPMGAAPTALARTGTGPYGAGPYGVGGYGRPGPADAVAAEVAVARGGMAGPAVREDPWHVLLRASGRISLGRISPGPVL